MTSIKAKKVILKNRDGEHLIPVVTSDNGFSMFDTVLKDHILTYEETKGLALQGTYVYKEAVAGSRYGYPTFYDKCVEEKTNATATETTLGNSTITMYMNANGHQFYDIADKESVDSWYNTYGRAWFYGIDTENERIFLPRNSKYFRIGDETTVGTNQDAGLPNITGSLLNTYDGNASGQSGAFYNSSIAANNGFGFDGNSHTTANATRFSASRSSALYGKTTNTVELDSVNMLLYICVGNTESEEALTNVTEITTSENDTLPWGYHFYSGELLEAPIGYIESLGQWNDGSDLYAQFFSKAVNKLGEAFAGGYIKNHTETYDDYDLVINQTDMTFRLPLLDGSEDLLSEKFEKLTVKTSGSTYIAPANGWFTVGGTATANDGGVYLYGTVSQIESSSTGSSGWLQVCCLQAQKGEEVMFTYSNTNNQYVRFNYAQGNGSLYFKVANAVQNLELLNAGEVLEAVQKIGAKPHIVETYINGKSWYRVYSDGWCEQGSSGGTSTSGGSAAYDITFLKPFKDTNYTGLCSATNSGGSSWAGIGFVPKTTSTAQIQQWIDGTGKFTNISWQASGYIA